VFLSYFPYFESENWVELISMKVIKVLVGKWFRDFNVILLFSFFYVFNFSSIIYLVAEKRKRKN
jgi:hypothetical protein